MRDPGLRGDEHAELLVVDDDAMRRDDVPAEQVVRSQQARPGRARRLDEKVAIPTPRPFAAQDVGDLRRTLGDVGRDRQAELCARLVELERHGVRRVGRDTGPHAVGERVLGPIADPGEMLERARNVRSEDLQVHGRAQAQLRAGNGCSAAVTAVPDRRHARAEAQSRTEARDVDVLLPADLGLPLHVERDPLRKVAQPIAEAGVHRVFEMRVRVDEARQDDRVLVADTGSELVRRPDRGNPAVLDRDRAALDRRPLDRQHPVRGQNLAHGSDRLAASRRCDRRSMITDSQIDPSYNTISGIASSVVVTGSIPGRSTATTATMK